MAKNESKNENKVKKHFFKDFKAELKKVIWPTPKQLINNTVAVVAIVLITTAIVFVLDVVFDMMNKYGISHLQSIVNEKYNSEEDTNSDNNTENNDNQESNQENGKSGESSDANEQNDNSSTEENTEVPADGAESNNTVEQ